MCLALPARVVQIQAPSADGSPTAEWMAQVDMGGVRKHISLALLDDVQTGDYVVVHAGYALTRLDPEEAEHTLRLFAQPFESPSPTQSSTQPSGSPKPIGPNGIAS